ncbi:MAG: YbaY family lipoprotein [Fimbriimonadaceae bacterium]|nr:YbaY family lipoprotein [Fimbriimonadaceae bacterium]
MNLNHVTGTVAYRERIALAPTAVVTVSLDRFRGDDHVNVSEVTIRPEGGQLPISFSLPYNDGVIQPGDRYGLRARITVEGNTLFESDSHTMVVTNGKNAAELVLVRAAPVDQPTIHGVTWTLMSLNERDLRDWPKPPHIILNVNGHDFGGNTGVNVFGGVYEWNAPTIMLDPQVSTMMAGSDEAMALEREFMETLPKVTRLAVEEGELVLYRGDREIMRFRLTKA